MSKRVTKIICATLAAVSAATLAFLPACKNNWGGVSGEKDNSAYKGSNGGFLTETEDYVYFINGKASNTDSNEYGSVLKGSVQRLKKSEMENGNYASTQTVVPSVFYAGTYNAGLYIYGGYIYYTTPSSDKNADGEVLNTNLEFRRTSLDGSDTSGSIWTSSELAVDYRYVEVGGTVYILYALSENLYGTSVTNIHSVNCSTGNNTVLAYNVKSYAFDTVDATNPYVYFTMDVPQYVEQATPYKYNQLYMVRADASSSPRDYDFTGVEDYNPSDNPMYINYGMHVFDGIGKVNYEAGRVNQFNYAYDTETKDYDKNYSISYSDLKFTIKWYKDGTLYYTRETDDSNVGFYSLEIGDIDADKNGKVDESWDAVAKIAEQTAVVNANVTTEYEFVTLSDGLYALNATSSGVTKSKIENGKIGEALYMTDDSASAVLSVREEANLGHTYLYYSVTGGNGYTVNRVAIDGGQDDYGKLPSAIEPDLTYDTVNILDLDASSDWFKPEFVDNRLFFASEIGGMQSYNYIMVCDLNGENGIMSNKEIKALNKKFDAVTEKIEEYDEKENADGSAAYDKLSKALKYLFNTGDTDYIDELIQAYVDLEGRDKEYVYSEASVAIYKDFAAAEGDWAEYKADEMTKTINGVTVRANMRDYYYTVVGKMTDADIKGLNDYYKGEYMESYPVVENTTWWDKLSTGGKVGAAFGITEACMLVIGGGIILVAYLVTRKKAGAERGEVKRTKVDLTDDKSMDVYGDESGESDGGEQ